MVSLQELFIVFCKEGSSLLADRCTSQSDLEKLESTDCDFLAWITDSTVVEFDNFAETSDDVRRKLLSFAQDIVYISTKGRKTMPKHVALGLTMRHMTGSSSLIGIFNGLGHSVSHSGVLEHDTARESNYARTTW